MEYFASYLSTAGDEVDISVHCDVTIFEWLMRYVKRDEKGAGPAPELDVATVVSVLISSDFLKMAALVEDCLRFIAAHAAEVVQLPIDLSCIRDPLVTRLAGHMDEEAMESLAAADQRGKLTPRVFRAALQRLLATLSGPLQRCVACGQLYLTAQQGRLRCHAGRPFVDYRGRIVAQHRPSASWSLRAFLHRLRANRVPWRTIYWRVWGVVHDASCARCCRDFQLAHLAHCAYHPRVPAFDAPPPHSGAGAHGGYYPCCSAPAQRFDAYEAAPGCTARGHEPATARGRGLAAVARARGDLVLVPYSTASTPALRGGGGAGAHQSVDGWDAALGTVKDPSTASRGAAALPVAAGPASVASSATAFFHSPFPESPYIVYSSNSVVPHPDATHDAGGGHTASGDGGNDGHSTAATSSTSVSSSSSSSASSSSPSPRLAATELTSDWTRRRDAHLPPSNVWSRSRNEVVYSERGPGGEGRRPRRDIAPGSPRKRRLWRMELLMEEDTRRMQHVVRSLQQDRRRANGDGAATTREASGPGSSLGQGRLFMHCAAVRAAGEMKAAGPKVSDAGSGLGALARRRG